MKSFTVARHIADAEKAMSYRSSYVLMRSSQPMLLFSAAGLIWRHADE